MGRYLWPDGRSYTGFWENGKQHGLGKYKDENDEIKFGVWVYGKRNRWLDETDIEILSNQNDEYYRQIIEFDPNNYLLSDSRK